MVGALIALAVVVAVLVVALAVAVAMAKRRSSELAEAVTLAATASREAEEAAAERDQALAATEAAEAAEKEAEALALSAIARAEHAESLAEQAQEDLRLARTDATLDSHAGGLWVLEALRLERRWRREVAPGKGSPFDGSLDPARVALEVLVEAAREEVGASFDLQWSVVEAVPSPAALRLTRLAEELLAEAAMATDGGDLEVESSPGGLTLRLSTEPAFEISGELAAALEVLGEVGIVEGGALVVGVRWDEPEAQEAAGGAARRD